MVGWITESREELRIEPDLGDASLVWGRPGATPSALYRGGRLAGPEWRRPGDDVEWARARVPRGGRQPRARTGSGGGAPYRARGLGALTAASSPIVAAVFAGNQRDIAQSRDLASKSAAALATDPAGADVALEALRHDDTAQARARCARRRSATARRASSPRARARVRCPLRAPTVASRRRRARTGPCASGASPRAAGGRGSAVATPGEVRAVSFSSDGKRLAAATRRGELAVAPARGVPSRRGRPAAGRDYASSIDLGPTTALAIGTDGGRVAVVSLRDGSVRELGRAPRSVVYAVAFDGAGRRVVSAERRRMSRGSGASPAVSRSRSPTTRTAPARPRRSSPRPSAPTASRCDGRRVAGPAVGCADRPRGRADPGERRSPGVRAFSGDGRRIVTAGVDGVVHVTALGSGSSIAELRGHKGPTRAAFVPGGGRIVSAGEEDGTLRRGPRRGRSRSAGSRPRLRSDGGLVVSVEAQRVIHVWNPAPGPIGASRPSGRRPASRRPAPRSSPRRPTVRCGCGTSRAGDRGGCPGARRRGRDPAARAADRDRRQRRSSSSARTGRASRCAGTRGASTRSCSAPTGATC